MIGRRILGANVRFKPPVDWDEATQGPCADLHVKVTHQPGGEIYCESAWEPTPAEQLAAVCRQLRGRDAMWHADPPIRDVE